MEAAATHESPPARPTPREYLQTIVLAAAVAWLVATALPTPEDRAQRKEAEAAAQAA